ncbi:sugar phosphate isomerase/epimerase [Panacibacter ginsenosidivorans]|uniref:Sugar phosphate isomerase/epimerase n=1 Tax=Panacibacter ginsenosidivorans TaxID=1813871 RepID=A0A5B8V8S9_9BACT|nr:sugar phosphate isomerase/epimerase family protein [Panacibacter ginsenosidivorans]QEC67116.1 sugar phosphate isomerase/epimerase [Panacibacter ginsenosidivorans]
MRPYSRRKFIGTAASIAGAAFAGPLMSFKKQTPLLSFSTLGCPDWSFDEIINFAAANNYNGIEIRGIRKELDLTKCNEFSTKENIAASKQKLKDKGLAFVCLGSSATMHYKEEKERQKNLDDGKKFIDLANELGCPYVRVFPNNLPKEQDKNETLELITQGLLTLGDYAKNSNVTVLMETHGDLTKTEDIVKVITPAAGKHVGLVWDVANMWNATKESPSNVYPQLKKYIHHTHIKDSLTVDGKINYKFLGKGEVPIFEAIDLLHKGGYKGYYSFEWEKLWHPEIEAPELAFADYSKAMQQHFGK